MGPRTNICAICGGEYEPNAVFCPKDGAPLGSAAPIGDDPYLGIELLGQIRIERLIGIGSMGRVYRGFQAGVKRSVAVKILHRELSANPKLVARFQREAEIASRLSHPGVVDVMMAGRLDDHEPTRGAMYIVMEHIDGISLRSALAAAGSGFPLPRALRIVLQICEAVGEAHALGVVHRDLKPENIMLTRRAGDADFVKVLDFGIARLPGANSQAVTQAGLIFGTARYISPEGASGTPVGPQADVYAIATMLYQMLAGRTPFSGDSTVELLAQQMNEPPLLLRSFERSAYVPEAIASVVMQNLNKRPEERSSDARAFGRALAQAARAGGLVPEDLLPRSPLLRTPGKPPGFASIEPTKQLAFTKSNQPEGVAAREVARPGEEVSPVATGVGPSKSGATALAFIVGCLLGGVVLAVLGARGSCQAGAHDDGPPREGIAEGGGAFLPREGTAR